MKKSILGLVAIGALIGAPAMAADMALKAPPPPPVCIWCGFYVGVNVGGAWTTTNDAITAAIPGGGVAILAPAPAMTDTAATSEQLSGIIGGGHIGYNWQLSRVVLGVEADIDGSSQSGTGTGPVLGPTGTPVPGVTMSTTNKIRDFGTVRARLGLPFDQWMPYITGGFAWQNVSSALTGINAAGTFPLMSNSATLSGWTIGGGVEGHLTNRWTWRAEYLYIDTGTLNSSTGALPATSPIVTGGFAPAGTVISESTRFTNNVFRVGVSYYFGGPVTGY